MVYHRRRFSLWNQLNIRSFYAHWKCRAAQSAEIQSFGVHLSMCFIVRKERAPIPRPNVLEFSFLRYRAAHGCAQEPTLGPAALFDWKILLKKHPLVPQQNIAGS